VTSAAIEFWKENKNGHYAVNLSRDVKVLARALGYEDVARPAGEAADLIFEIVNLREDLGEEDPAPCAPR